MPRRAFVNGPDESELWGEYRRAQKERRADRLPGRQEAIEALRGKGFDVRSMNDGYQFRIDGKLDLYPIHQRYHVLKTGKRGGYQDPVAVAMRFLRGGAHA